MICVVRYVTEGTHARYLQLAHSFWLTVYICLRIAYDVFSASLCFILLLPIIIIIIHKTRNIIIIIYRERNRAKQQQQHYIIIWQITYRSKTRYTGIAASHHNSSNKLAKNNFILLLFFIVTYNNKDGHDITFARA